MKNKKLVIISLGGSVIFNKKSLEINTDFLESFKQIILKNTKKYKFVIITGGGIPARTYMDALNNTHIKNKNLFQSYLGISITRLNARLLSYFFQKEFKKGIPHEPEEIKHLIKDNNLVFCGALKYIKNQTSDTNAAELANYFHTDFINITNVPGLFDKDPNENKDANFIPEISHKDFLKIANKIKFHPGQHFVLDQKAAKIIKKHNITTYIIGPNPDNLDNLLNNKHYIGTVIT